jgi:hypothetical protein
VLGLIGGWHVLAPLHTMPAVNGLQASPVRRAGSNPCGAVRAVSDVKLLGRFDGDKWSSGSRPALICWIRMRLGRVREIFPVGRGTYRWYLLEQSLPPIRTFVAAWVGSASSKGRAP